MFRVFLALCTAALGISEAALAYDKKPPVPPGRDPGGVAIALVCSGIDYTLPHLARRLARDGEGELIGWDLEDRDRQPFDKNRGHAAAEPGGDGTTVAAYLLAAHDVRLIPVRLNPADPLTIARAIAFVAQTPARVVVVPGWARQTGDREAFRQAVMRFKELLIVVDAEDYQPVLDFDNVLSVTPGRVSRAAVDLGGITYRLADERLAVASAGLAAAALLGPEPRLGAAALKRRLLEGAGADTWRPRR